MKYKILTAFMVCAFVASAQVQTPYSMYGYGILGDRATSMQRQMGSVGYAMNSGRQVNVMNPASYAAVDSLTFLFDMGADVSMIWSREGSAKERATGGGLDYLTMQFPLSKHFGGSVGVVPLSSVGYAFGNEIKHGAMENQGSGGINELYLGFAGTVKGFSLGFNVSYNFGNIINDVFSTPASGGNSKTEHVMKIRDWGVLIGAQYTARLNRHNRMVLGVTYSPKKTLLGTTWVTTQETTLKEDPVEIVRESMKGRYYMPNAVGAGVSFTHERVSRFTAEFDYTWQGWKDARYSALTVKNNAGHDVTVFEGKGYNMDFQDRSRFALGLEYVPKLRGSYLQRVAYRLGAYYTDDYLKIKGNGLRDFGVAAGFGFPTIEGKTIINLGLEWKMRQARPESLIKENYFNITLGVNFNEVWFFKRRIR